MPYLFRFNVDNQNVFQCVLYSQQCEATNKLIKMHLYHWNTFMCYSFDVYDEIKNNAVHST